MNIYQLFDAFPGLKVGVIGDLMLDTYLFGHVDRISPEAPVPVVVQDARQYRIGGAGNVALNTHSLGAPTTLFSVTGDDEYAVQLDRELRKAGIDTRYLVKSKDRITTNKTRVISRNQQMIRLDAEITTDLSGQDEQQLLAHIRHFIETEKPQVLILEDYNKGVLTATLIDTVIGLGREHNIITAVDPKRKNFFQYKGVTIFKPNLKEVKEGLNLLPGDIDLQQLQRIHGSLHQQLQHELSFITLSDKGVFYQQDDHAAQLPSHRRTIADVSGAGDTVIAVASLVYAATRDVNLMAEIANIAGGLVCEEVGTVAIDRQKLLEECLHLLPQS